MLQFQKNLQKKVSLKKYLVKNYLQKAAMIFQSKLQLFPLCSES